MINRLNPFMHKLLLDILPSFPFNILGVAAVGCNADLQKSD